MRTRVRAALGARPPAREPARLPTLVESARRAGEPVDPARAAFLGDLGRALRRRKRGVLVILGPEPGGPEPGGPEPGGPDARGGLGDLVRRSFPGLRIRRLDTTLTESEQHAQLAAWGQCHAIVDEAGPAGSAARFRNVFLHLVPRGAYLVRDLRYDGAGDPGDPGDPGNPGDPGDVDDVWGLVSRLVRLKAGPAPRAEPADPDLALARAVGTVATDGRSLRVTNRLRAMANLREEEVDAVLRLAPDRLGGVLERRPPVDFPAVGALVERGRQPVGTLPTSFRVPQLCLREYRDATCLPRQVVFQGNLLLPDSFRHPQARQLRNRALRSVTPRFAVPRQAYREARDLPGSYFYLDSEWPGHFGHTLTEQLSRLWAWPAAKAAYPGLKALLAPNPRAGGLAPFEREVYAAAGIGPDDLATFDAPVRVETLLAATPMFSMPAYVHPAIGEIWSGIGDALAAPCPASGPARRIFATRAETAKRSCRNAVEVEALFVRHGFAVIRPEEHPLAEQVALFREAEVVAGFAGSALFNLCFCGSAKQVVMLASRSYAACNEYMIAAVRGHRIQRFLCEPDAWITGRGWDRDPFHSPFEFDFARDGERLEETLSALG